MGNLKFNYATNDPYIVGHSIINYPRLHHILKYIAQLKGEMVYVEHSDYFRKSH